MLGLWAASGGGSGGGSGWNEASVTVSRHAVAWRCAVSDMASVLKRLECDPLRGLNI